MDCLIDNVITRWYIKKGRKVEVIRRYIKMKYGVSMDKVSLQKRIMERVPDYKLTQV